MKFEDFSHIESISLEAGLELNERSHALSTNYVLVILPYVPNLIGQCGGF